jgi:sugar (pentulose or hexulose) kinase
MAHTCAVQVEGGQTSTGSVINWYRRLVGEPDYDTLAAEAAVVPPGAEGCMCLDHFQGNRTPHTDAHSRGAITGLTLRHGRGHVFRALLESICFGTEHIFETMRANGYSPTSVTVAGGATRSPLWMQIHADISNIPFILTKVRGGWVRAGGHGMACVEGERGISGEGDQERCVGRWPGTFPCPLPMAAGSGWCMMQLGNSQ